MEGQAVGCDNLGCQITLGGFVMFGLFGAFNQFRMERIMKKMEDNPEFAGGSWCHLRSVLYPSGV